MSLLARSRKLSNNASSPMHRTNETHFHGRSSPRRRRPPIHWPAAAETPVDGKQRAAETKALAAKCLRSYVCAIAASSALDAAAVARAGNKVLKARTRIAEARSLKACFRDVSSLPASPCFPWFRLLRSFMRVQARAGFLPVISLAIYRRGQFNGWLLAV